MQLLTLLKRDRLVHVVPVLVTKAGDLTNPAATQYLTAKRNTAPDIASKIIAFCGARIQLLQRILENGPMTIRETENFATAPRSAIGSFPKMPLQSTEMGCTILAARSQFPLVEG